MKQKDFESNHIYGKMKSIYYKCANIMCWLIENKSESMPKDVYDEICGNEKNQVTEELRKHGNIYFASNRLHSVKLDDAMNILAYYKDKL